MKTLMFCLILTTTMAQNKMIFDFDNDAGLKQWVIENDVVMGGVSQSKIQLNNSGNAVFSGEVSLENNGGFAQVKHITEINDVQSYAYVTLKVKGKPSTYQFRIKKNKAEEVHSYVQEFEVTSEWQTIQLKLSSFYPRYRGRSLNLPNFGGDSIEEVAILIGNKKKEEFQLEIDKVYLSK